MESAGTFRAVAVAATVLLAIAPAGLARQGADDPAGSGGGSASTVVRASGSCSLGSTAKLKLKAEDGGRAEIEFEVDENRRGTVWGVTITRNGSRVVSRRARTTAPSGSFTVRRVVTRGSAGTRVVAVARRAATGEVCRATARL